MTIGFPIINLLLYEFRHVQEWKPAGDSLACHAMEDRKCHEDPVNGAKWAGQKIERM